MAMISVAMVVLGLLLLFTAPALARMVSRDGADPGGLTRVLQGAALLLVIGGFLVWPRSPDATAFPPPPDGTEAPGR